MAESGFTAAEIAAAIAETHGSGKPAPARGSDGKFQSGELAADAAEGDKPAEDAPPQDDAPQPEPPDADDEEAHEAAPKEEAEAKEKEGNKPVPSKTWAAVFRREKAARDREAQHRAAISEAQSARQQALEARQEAQSILEQLKADPYSFVEKHAGFDFDQWAKRRLAGGKPEPGDETQKLRGEMEKLRQEMVQRETQAQQKAQEAAQQQQVEHWLEGLSPVLSDPKYELIRLWGAQDEVPALAGIELRKSGRWLTQSQAADKILNQLELHLSRLEKAGKIVKAGVKPAAPAPEKRAAAKPQVDDGHQEELVVKGRKRTRPMTRSEEIAYLVKKNLGA